MIFLLFLFLSFSCTSSESEIKFLGSLKDLFSLPKSTKIISDYSQNSWQDHGFALGTLVKIPEGYAPIENLKTGDVVVSFNVIGEVCASRVINTGKYLASNYLKMFFTDQEIEVGFDQELYYFNQNSWNSARLAHVLEAISSYSAEFNCLMGFKYNVEEKELYLISVENRNFFVTTKDLWVHNASCYAFAPAAIAVANALVQIGQVILNNAVTSTIGYTIALQSIKNQQCALCIEESNADTLKDIDLPERNYYEFRLTKLLQLKQELLRAKNDLCAISCVYQDGSANFTHWYLAQHVQETMCQKPLELSKAKELTLNGDQIDKLNQARQSYLEKIEKDILNLQISLGFHFNELIECKNRTFKLFVSTQEQFENYLDLNFYISKDTLSKACEFSCMLDNLTDTWELQNAELKQAIEYYNKSKSAEIIKNTSNIQGLLAEENVILEFQDKRIKEYEAQSVLNKTHAERHFNSCGLSKYYIAEKNNEFKQKEKYRRAQQFQEAQQSRMQIPTPPNPKKDDDKTKKEEQNQHSHGKYEDAGYHHRNSNGLKSPAPKNGQKALDNSLLIPDCDKGNRISLCDNEFVVLYRTAEKLYHGHVRTWDQLTQGMRTALQKAKLVRLNGKVI